MRLDRDGSFTQWLAFGAHPRRLQDDHHGAALLGEALKNSCKNLAGADLVDRFAVSLGIDPPRHCFAGFMADQAERKHIQVGLDHRADVISRTECAPCVDSVDDV